MGTAVGQIALLEFVQDRLDAGFGDSQGPCGRVSVGDQSRQWLQSKQWLQHRHQRNGLKTRGPKLGFPSLPPGRCRSGHLGLRQPGRAVRRSNWLHPAHDIQRRRQGRREDGDARVTPATQRGAAGSVVPRRHRFRRGRAPCSQRGAADLEDDAPSPTCQSRSRMLTACASPRLCHGARSTDEDEGIYFPIETGC